MKRLLTALALAVSFAAYAQIRPQVLTGPSGEPVKKIQGTACTQSGTTVTCDGGTIPALQANTLGGVKGNGALACTGTDKISGFLSSGAMVCSADQNTTYVLPAPTSTTLGGVKSLTCGGTDKVSAIGTDGIPVCSADQTGAGGGAPATATYITQTPDATLSAEQALSALGTGILKSTTGTGVVSIAAAGTDYQAPLTLPLSIANGGTNGSASPTSGGVDYGTGTAHAFSAAGTSGRDFLVSGGTGAPTWTRGLQVAMSTADLNGNGTTFTDIPGVTFALVSGSTYRVMCKVAVTNASTTNGGRVQVVSPTITAATYTVSTMATSATVALLTNATAAAAWPAACTTSCIAQRYMLTIDGLVIPSASGTWKLQAAFSAAGTTLLASKGSWCSVAVL